MVLVMNVVWLCVIVVGLLISVNRFFGLMVGGVSVILMFVLCCCVSVYR